MMLKCTWDRNIDALDSWPPLPDENYRRSHYVVSEWLDKVCARDPTAIEVAHTFPV